MLGGWNFLSQLREGKTPQTQPPVEAGEKECAKRLITIGEATPMLTHFSSI